MDKQPFIKYFSYILIGSSLFGLGIVVGASLNLREENDYLINHLCSSSPTEAQNENRSFDIEIKFLKPKAIDSTKGKP